MDRRKLVRRPAIKGWLGRWIGLLLVTVLLCTGGPVGAQEPELVIPIPAGKELVQEDEVNPPAAFHPKLDSALNQLLEAQRTEGRSGTQAFAETRGMMLEGDRVQVILVSELTDIPGLAQAVEGLGGETQGHYEGLLQALVPLNALEPLADRSEVQFIRDPWRAIELESPEVGAATTEGVVASNAAAWHSAGYSGTGVRVAVIDAGFTDYGMLLGSDLPGSVGTYDWTGSGMGGSAHGTACAEIVHDMAPGAMMDLHKVSTAVELGLAVTQAIADGVDVISMSLGWVLDGPGDGTGYLANIVHTARANGIFYATAAGNDAEVNWAGIYEDSGTSNYHAWDGGTLWYNFMGEGSSCVVFPAGYPIRGGLHWDDWSVVNQDYDLHLLRWPLTGSTLYTVASSTNPQNGGAGETPQEYISYTAAGGNCYAWVVERVSSTRDVCLRMIASKTDHFVNWTAARSLTFPADAPDAITVAAVDVNSPYPLESYSSQGPTFGPGGACAGGVVKPDIASYANVSTVSYGPEGFNGTSAATPHVAGAAALVRGRYPAYGVTEVQDFLENEALDLGTAGKDNLFGSGRLHLPADTELLYAVYLPLMFRNFGSGPVIPLVNGDFEAGPTGWTEYSTHGWDLILQETELPTTVYAYSGSWAVWLGGEYDDLSYIQQQVTVPADRPYLRYMHWISSADTCGYDYAGVMINNATVADIYDLCASKNTGGWVQHVVNLVAYAGQLVLLQIRVDTDSALNSNLFVDDVSFQASARASSDPPGVADEAQAAPRPGAGTRKAREVEPQPTGLFDR